MNTVVLDGAEMVSKQRAHDYLAEKLGLPSYYGHNLDALWDALSSINVPLNVRLVNEHMLGCNLNSDNYGRKLLQVFLDAAAFNPCFHFEILSQQT